MTHHAKAMLFPIFLVLYEIATYLSNDMYLPALPSMMSDLNFTPKQAQLTLTIWFLGGAVTPLIVGAISDRYGRRFILLWSGLLYIAATIIFAIGIDHHVLLTARFVQGCMVATMMVTGYAAIHELYEQKEAIRILALMGSISVLAPALGPLFGAIVLLLTSWRGIFWIIAIWASAAILLLYYWMPETLTPGRQHPLHFRSLMKRYARIVFNKNFMLLMLVEGLIFCGFLSWVTGSPLLIINSFHHSALVFGILQAGVFGAYIYGNYWVKKLLNSVGVHFLIHLGLMIAFFGGGLMLTFAVFSPHSLYEFLAGMIIFSFGAGLCFSPLNRMIIEASDAPMGTRVAIFTVFLTSFGALGSALSSLFFDGSLLSLALTIGIPSILACCINLLIIRRI